MSTLLAIGNASLSNMLRKPLIENGFDVITDEVQHRNQLNEFIEIQKPEMVIVHDYYLSSKFDNHSISNIHPKKRDEELLKLIDEWRIKYPHLRVVILCIRDPKDPLLFNLLERNVVDIFYERSLNIEYFINQIKEKPHIEI